ncbi:hypothetical protein FOA52_016274 [Chlamydomonas sp. UWO 241]|nr:hypothetical protein FOA52_016274 [Chlamydomonas sp. UWO 241]
MRHPYAPQAAGFTTADVVGVVDEWALRFFAEMDYTLEAANAEALRGALAGLSGVEIADVVPKLSSIDVLTTRWVAGEKLGESSASDVRQLCDTLLNAYLVQLLEAGVMHADPHPGNLLRTPEGKICILDYGLITEVGGWQ